MPLEQEKALTINITILECKFLFTSIIFLSDQTINITILECKYININIKTNFILSINITILECKLS